jgi:opacity protein-like surface antigen
MEKNAEKRWDGRGGCRFSVVVVIVALLVTPAAFAASRATGISTGGGMGIARFFDGDLGTGLNGRVFLEYAPYIHEIGLRLTGGYLRFSDDVESGNETFRSTEDVTFEDFYATAGLIYRLSRKNIVPFLTANVGLYRYRKEDVSPASGPIIGGVQVSVYDTVETKEGNDFGLNAGGGIEYFMSDRIAVSVELLVHSIHGEVDDQIVDLSVLFRWLPQRRYE